MITDKSSIHERSVFQLGNWHLVTTGFQQGDGFTGVFAVHVNCVGQALAATGLIRTIHNQCFRCGDVVPDELQALVILHRWGWDEQ